MQLFISFMGFCKFFFYRQVRDDRSNLKGKADDHRQKSEVFNEKSVCRHRHMHIEQDFHKF